MDLTTSCRRLTLPCLAVIYLKNRVNRAWLKVEQSPNEVVIPEDEKARFRDRLLPILAQSPPLIRQQLIPILQRILHYDFPDKWPTFLDYTNQLLNTNDAGSVLAGLQCLLAICRAYRFKNADEGNRTHFDKIVEMTFPRLLAICNELVNQESDEAGEMLHFALKAYKHATWVGCLSDGGCSCSQVLIWCLRADRNVVFPQAAVNQHCVGHHLLANGCQDNSSIGHARRADRA
jgi:importin-7